MNPLIPIGQSLQEKCTRCRTNVHGHVDKQNKAQFVCPVCQNSWSYPIRCDGKGSRFTAQDLEALMKRNPALKVSDPFKQKT